MVSVRLDDCEELATRAWYYAQLAQPKPAKQPKQPKQSKAVKSPPAKAMSDEVLFDFDCNLTHADLSAGVDALLATAASVGVRELLVPGATLAESRAAIALCSSLPAVSPRFFPSLSPCLTPNTFPPSSSSSPRPACIPTTRSPIQPKPSSSN